MHGRIGAGPVGLAVARGLKKNGVPHVQFEADADLGGNWRHGVYTTAHIISSRKTIPGHRWIEWSAYL